MMTTKERQRVQRYINSEGLKAAWHYIVIVLTMGNVDTAVEEYYEENERIDRNRVAIESMVSSTSAPVPSPYTPMGGGNVSRPADIGGYSYDIHDTDDGEIDLITAAIIAQSISQSINDSRQESVEYDETGGEEGWSGFGGGGDASGGGAGGSWDDSDSYSSSDDSSSDSGSDD
jgi:uncharacterized membrane protein YgcG